MISFFTESSNKYLSDDFFDMAPAPRTDTEDMRSSKLTESTLSKQVSDARSEAAESQYSRVAQSQRPVGKKDLAAFMKAKLAQTKISSSVKTGVSATSQPKFNFNRPPPAKPLPQYHQKSPVKKSKPKRKVSSSDSDNSMDLAAAN